MDTAYVYYLFFLTGCVLVIGSNAFQIGAHISSFNGAAPTFVSRISYPNANNIRPAPRNLHQSSSISFKLYYSLQNDVDASSSLEEEPEDLLVWLKQRFNFSEEVLTRITDFCQDSLTSDLVVLDDRVNWLQKRLKLTDKDLANLVRRNPKILTCRPDTNLGPTLDNIQEKLSLKTMTLSRMVQKDPRILGTIMTESLEPRLNWIQNRLYLNETKALQKFVSKAPRILSCSIDGKLEPTFKWLQERLNLTEPQAAKLCVRAPRILSFNLDVNIRPTSDWLEQRLDLNSNQLGAVMRKAPTILTLRVDSLEQKLCWLQKRLCLDDASLKKIIISRPSILSYSQSSIEPKFQWLQEQLFLAEDDDVGKLVTKFPQLLGMSIETNLEPTLDFIKGCIGDERAVEVVVQTPVVLGVSLEKRLKPRLEEVKRIGIEIDAACLKRMAQNTEETWCKSLTFQAKKLAKSNADLLW